jgi:hypothetical protein
LKSLLLKRRVAQGHATWTWTPAFRHALRASRSLSRPFRFRSSSSAQMIATPPAGGTTMPTLPRVIHVSAPVVAHTDRPVSGPSTTSNASGALPVPAMAGNRTAAPSFRGHGHIRPKTRVNAGERPRSKGVHQTILISPRQRPGFLPSRRVRSGRALN